MNNATREVFGNIAPWMQVVFFVMIAGEHRRDRLAGHGPRAALAERSAGRIRARLAGLDSSGS